MMKTLAAILVLIYSASACTNDVQRISQDASEGMDLRTEAQKRQSDQAVVSLEVADGLEATLFASEPMVINPTNIDVDARGRIWVCEGRNYRPERNPENILQEGGDRILILEDTDGDGRADTRKVFYQGPDVNVALGLAVLGNKVIVSSSPNVLVFTDEDGDDKPDSKEVLYTGISGEQHDHGMHAFVFGPDGRLYFNFGNAGEQLKDRQGNVVVDKAGNRVVADRNPYQEGMVFRATLDGSNVEVLGHNFRNNYETTVDSYGTLWQSDNDDDGNQATRINYVMEYGNYGFRDEITGENWRTRRTGMHEEIPRRHWHLNDPGVVPNLLQTGAGSPTGIAVYEGRLLPEVFHDQIIHADAGPNVVRAYPVTVDGAGYKAHIVNILQGARDRWFRPSDVAVAPDGSLIVADWYDPGVGGHQMGDFERGRIFRVAPPGTPYRTAEPDLTTPEGAVTALQSPNMATRYLAWQTLHDGGPEAETALQALWKADNPRHRARALWLLAKIDGRAEQYVDEALQDADPNIRITGLRVARDLDLDVLSYVSQLVRDPSPQVRREGAIALRHRHAPEAASLWAALARQHDGQDRWYLEALGIGADQQWDRFFETWLDQVGDDWTNPAGRDIVWRARTAAALPMLATLISDAATPPTERLRYFRAFDFHQDPARDEVLLDLLDTPHPDKEHIAVLALQHLSDPQARNAPQVKAALQTALASVAGTQAFANLVDHYERDDQNEELLRMALAMPDSTLGIQAATLALRFDGASLFHEIFEGNDRQAVDAALTVLGFVETENARNLLQTVLANAAYETDVRRVALENLGRGWSGKEKVLDIVKNGALPEEFEPTAASLLFSALSSAVRAEAAQYLQMPETADGTPLAPLVELVVRTGNPIAGKAVFAKACMACHVVHGEGVDFGPALSEIGNKSSKEALYTSILHPSTGISFGYEGYVLKLKDSNEVVGYITSDTEDTIELRMQGGVSNRYSKADIASQTPLATSLMPSLQHTMTEQELVDLVEYLTTLKKAS